MLYIYITFPKLEIIKKSARKREKQQGKRHFRYKIFDTSF